MARTDDERAHGECLDREYAERESAVFAEIEREALGCDYGGTSWTDREEAERVASMLGLAPGVRVLEIGAGAGWPGLFLANATGCDVTLADLPLHGLRRARRRIVADSLGGRARAAAADAARLPFRSASFDAVLHCDVLC